MRHPALLFLSHGVVVALLGCGKMREEGTSETRAVRREAAGRELAQARTQTRTAFRALPPCPPDRGDSLAPGSVTAWRPARGGVRLPPNFRPDTGPGSGYMHGGARYRAGIEQYEVIYGHWGWASFTRDHASGGRVPGGCRLLLHGVEYLVSQARDSSAALERATAVAITDTVDTRGGVLHQVTAPAQPLSLLRRILLSRAGG